MCEAARVNPTGRDPTSPQRWVDDMNVLHPLRRFKLPQEPPLVAGVRHSFRGKLMRVVLITTTIAVLVAGIAMLTRDLTVYRESWATDIASQASVVALAVAPALEFNDHATAEQYLVALRARPRILIAALYDEHGALYASYVRAGEPPPPARPPHTTGVQISGERVDLTQPVGTGHRGAGHLVSQGALRNRQPRVHLPRHLRAGHDTQPGDRPMPSRSNCKRALPSRSNPSAWWPARSSIAATMRCVRSGSATMSSAWWSTPSTTCCRKCRCARSPRKDTNRRLQLEIEVREAAEEAMREADRRKDEFLATLAHELRNPLAPIRHAVKLLESLKPTSSSSSGRARSSPARCSAWPSCWMICWKSPASPAAASI
jgi:hypothetical protein